ncbi:MAG: response regulator [Chloroflexi bacterium]|nr:response regulator [Chloroflexota bacterium]
MDSSRPFNIMVVDDNSANLRLLSAAFMEAGYRVRAALNGQTALRSAKIAPPDLILLDVRMPFMNGYQVCELLKADDALRHIPVVLISALNSDSERRRGIAAGAAGFICKPFVLDNILDIVALHLIRGPIQVE